jgi:hypothetical protein
MQAAHDGQPWRGELRFSQTCGESLKPVGTAVASTTRGSDAAGEVIPRWMVTTPLDFHNGQSATKSPALAKGTQTVREGVVFFTSIIYKKKKKRKRRSKIQSAPN